MTERGVSNWTDFRNQLIEVTAAHDGHAEPDGYYQRWLRALERLALEHGLVTSAELDAKTEALASDRHDGH